MTDDEHNEPWVSLDVELSEEKLGLLRTYEQARFALTYQECLGRPAPRAIVGGPGWLHDHPLDETSLATLRGEIVDRFNRDRPFDGWTDPGSVPRGDGDVRVVSGDPEQLIKLIDARVTAQIGEMAAGIVRDILKLTGRRKEGTE